MLKKYEFFLTALCIFILGGCDKSGENTKVEKFSGAVVERQPALLVTASNVSETAVIAESGMPMLARKYNCTACHAIDQKIVGPAWSDVAKKYKDDASAESRLILKVSKGGSGVWGTMPMPPNDQSGTRQADMKELVQFVLKLAK